MNYALHCGVDVIVDWNQTHPISLDSQRLNHRLNARVFNLGSRNCPFCDHPFCYNSCDESQAGGFTDTAKELAETDEQITKRIAFNSKIKIVQEFVLNLFNAQHERSQPGRDVMPPNMLSIIDTALSRTINDLFNNPFDFE